MTNLCRRRRRLYEQQLADTKKYLGELAGKSPFTSADTGRLETALKDPDLIDALEEILNIYVVYGVGRDLERLAASNVLFRRDTGKLPSLDELLPLDGSDPTYTGADQKSDKKVTPKAAYDRYFDWYIDAPEVQQGGRVKSGVAAFYERYPLLAHAVRTVTANHQVNINLACQRVSRDWSDIEAAFFSGRTLQQLEKIRTTGNDFHKGGKQVLILTFALSDGSDGRVVYKPSAVEIDCRIVGDSAAVNRIAPQGFRQEASLTELINKYNQPGSRPEGFTTRPLPTYMILPYNRDSVPDSYGYIQFLTHEPELKVQIAAKEEIPRKVGAAIQSVSLGDVRGSDWIITDLQEGQVFNYQLGALMAMAMAVSLSDLHVQNVIAHDRLPHLIDLEEALKRPMAKVADTYMTTVLHRTDDPEGFELKIWDDRTSKLRVGWDKAVGKPAACVLYRYRGRLESADPVPLEGPAGSDGERNRRALMSGLLDVVEVLATPACNDAVKRWVRGLERTIARLVILATAKYAEAGRLLYWKYGENSIGSLLENAGGYNAFKVKAPGGKNAFFFVDQVSSRRGDWNAKFDGLADDVAKSWNAPFFAAEHPTHAWRDYLNCDVPSFYHRLGSSDVLNTMGDVIDVAAVVAWQNDQSNISRPGALRETCGRPKLGGGYEKTAEITHLLPQRPIDMVVDQLDRLRIACGTAEGKVDFLTRALKGSGLEAQFTSLATGLPATDAGRAVASAESARRT